MFRYRLANIPENKERASCMLEGRRLTRDEWLLSEDRIDFRSLAWMVEEQESTDGAFPPEVPPPHQPEPVLPGPVETARRELQARGFPESELHGRPDAELLELLDFDRAISERS